jgi:cbb3-type cytochrome oxidase subunit 3
MRKSLILLVALAASGVALAELPTPHEVYQAANSGHLAQAQQMIEQVLQEKPRSGEAHYIAAEIYAREGNLSLARQELTTAESLEPGLPFARPASVAALQREIQTRSASGPPPALYVQNAAYTQRASSGFPFATVLILLGAIGVIWFVFRRRAHQAAYANTVPAVPGPAGYGAPGYGPGYGPVPMGGGIGSSIAGGLASGLAVGAGVVAGEELARHFLDSDGRQIPVEPQNESVEPDQNPDMGGQDFGVNDGSSWSDGGSSFGGDGGGGDSWT